jgi:lipopolysaccharide assembly outer membrane protein LptD (OstA)
MRRRSMVLAGVLCLNKHMQTPNLGFGPLPGGYQLNDSASPKRKRLAIFFVVGAILFALLILWSITSKHKDPAKEDLIQLAISQNETLRVSTAYGPKLGDTSTIQHNAELQATLTSNSNLVVAQLKQLYKVKSINSGAQKAAINKKTDATLDNAVTLNQLDQEFDTTMAAQLGKQLDLAVKAESEVHDQKTKEALANIATNSTDLRDRFNKSAAALTGGS